jgi:broad specificity phosphatase PhoE
MLPPLLLKGKTGGMSGGHSESLTAVNIHEVQNNIVSAQLQRAYQTAIPIAERHTLETLKLDALRECNFGAWEGLSRAEVFARSPQEARHLHEWERDMVIAPLAGERFADMHRRVCAAVEQLARAHSAQTIVLVSHVGPIKVLLRAAMGAPLTSSLRIFLDPATISQGVSLFQ